MTPKELKGKLEFISLWQPIKLFTDNGEVDLRDYYWRLFENLNGKRATMDDAKNTIEIKADEQSETIIKYENDKDGILILLEKVDGFGASNISAYLPNMLQQLNGREVVLSVSDNGIKISANPKEKVFGLYYTHNNCCKIPDDKIHEVCKIGTKDCCIFFCVSPNGFECLKFDSMSARMLLDRHSKKEMRASRIGNCAILGRKETPTDKIKV